MKPAAPVSRPMPARRPRRGSSWLHRRRTVLRRPFAAVTNFTLKKRRAQLLPLIARRRTWIARALGHSIRWLKNTTQPIRPHLPGEARSALCLLLTYAGVSSSTLLISAKALPFVFTTIQPDFILSPALA